MVLTTFPPEEELNVQEVNLSTAALKAGANHYGKFCEFQNNEYMLCKTEEKDPRKCLNEGKEVTSCALNFFRKVKGTCAEEFTQYANCIDRSSSAFDVTVCRNTQSVFDKCMLDKVGIERPDYGYYLRPKVHDTKRPKPEIYEPVFKKAYDEFPNDYKKK